MLWETIPDSLYDVTIFQSKDMSKYSLSKVFVNGFWVGLIQKSKVHPAAEQLR